MQTALRWVAVFGIVVSCASAYGRDIFVDNVAGNNLFLGKQARPLNDGTGPVKTIGRALEIAVSSDRVVLANTGQSYRESVSLVGSRHGGAYARPLTIVGNGAILEGADPIEVKRWQHVVGNVFRFRPRHLVYQQLFLNDRPLVRILCSNPRTTPPELKPLEWSLFQGHVYFRCEPLRRPEDYALTVATRQVGITLYHVEHVAIVDLIVQGFQLDGINAHNSAREIALSRVTSRGNGRAGVAVGGASLVNIESSLLGNNGKAQLLTSSYSETFVRESNLLSNTAPAWLDRGGVVMRDGERIEGGLDERPTDDFEEPAEEDAAAE